MKNKFTIYILFLLAITSCKKKSVEIVCPFTIQTHMKSGVNGIEHVFALTNNTFVIMTQDRANNFSTLYHYDSQTHFIDSLVISGQAYSKPIIEPDNSFIMIGYDVDSTPGVSVVKIDNNLKKIKSRNIEFLYAPSGGEFRYYNKLAKLANGNYVIGTTHEQYPNLMDKIVLFCVKDIFKDTQPLWRVNPASYDGKWMEEMQGDEYGNFYIVADDHLQRTTNWVVKYDSTGNLIYENYFPHTFDNFNVMIEKNKIIYHDWWSFYSFDLQGNQTDEVPNGSYGRATSDLIKINNNYYYTSDTINSDGKFVEVRKTDDKLKTIKSNLFGNRGTNNFNYRRYLIQLTSGDMVAVALVENPDLTGNIWLLQRFNSELEMEK